MPIKAFPKKIQSDSLHFSGRPYFSIVLTTGWHFAEFLQRQQDAVGEIVIELGWNFKRGTLSSSLNVPLLI